MTSPERLKPTLLAGWIAASALFVFKAWPSFWTTVDDAWISARYARSFAEGYGLVYSPDEPPVEGYTNLLWVLWLSVGEVLGIEPYLFMCGSGLVCAVLTIGAAMGFTHALIGEWTPWPLLTGLVVALSPHLMTVATNGLESSMFMLVTVSGSWAVLVARGPWRYPAGFLLALSATVRPEGLALVGAWMVLDLWRNRDRLNETDTWAIVATGIAVLGAMTTWRLVYYGAPVPNTFPAKAKASLFTSDQLWKNNVRYMFFDGPFWPIAGAMITSSLLVPGERLVRALPIGIALLWAAVAMNVELWMPGARLFLQGYVLAMPAAVAALARMPVRGGMGAGSLLFVGALVGSVTLTAHNRMRDRHHSTLPGNQAQIAAHFLAQQLPRGEWVVIRDAGVFAYWSAPHVNVFETHQRALTRLHPDGANTDMHAAPTQPALVVTTTRRTQWEKVVYRNDRFVLKRLQGRYVYLGRVHQHYHRFYDVFARADLNLQPLPKEAVTNHKGAVMLELTPWHQR